MDKNKIALLGAGLLAGVLLAGCAHKDPLVGTWKGTYPTPRGLTANTTLTLTEDGKDTMNTQMTGPGMSARIDGAGTYTVSGSTLTQTFTTLNFNGRPFPRSKGPIPEAAQFKIEGDTLTIVSPQGGTQTLTRRKS